MAARPAAATKLMILPPLIHGAAQWGVMTAITTGQTVVFASVVDHWTPRRSSARSSGRR